MLWRWSAWPSPARWAAPVPRIASLSLSLCEFAAGFPACELTRARAHRPGIPRHTPHTTRHKPHATRHTLHTALCSLDRGPLQYDACADAAVAGCSLCAAGCGWVLPGAAGRATSKATDCAVDGADRWIHAYRADLKASDCHGWTRTDADGTVILNSANNMKCNEDGSFTITQFIETLNCDAGTGTVKTFHKDGKSKNFSLNQVYWEPGGGCIPEWLLDRVLPLDHQRWWRVGE